MQLIQFTSKGLYCAPGDFYLDPWQPVKKAVITHGHSDHAKFGHQQYLCHEHTVPIIRLRLGDVQCQSLRWNEPIYINSVKVSLHPAGHIIGSSQVRLEYQGEVWVFTGDYKLENDGISGQFEPVKCNALITESTFGLPIYKWKPQEEIFSSMGQWITANQTAGRNSILIGYSLGKAQRIAAGISNYTDRLLMHGAIYNMHTTLLQAGFNLPMASHVNMSTPKELLKNAVIIAPSGADGSSWIRRFAPYSVGVCSGWMQVRGAVRRRNADAGFVLSDHADWSGLLTTVKETGAEKVYVTHGFQAAFSKYLNEQGIYSAEVKTEYGIVAEEENEQRSSKELAAQYPVIENDDDNENPENEAGD